VEIPKIWEELPVKSRYVELAPWLLVMAAILFLLEIFERRTGWVSKSVLGRIASGTGVSPVRSEGEETHGQDARATTPWLMRKPAQSRSATVVAKKTTAGPVAAERTEPKPVPAKPASTESAIDALRKARERAKSRTDKER
jgi:hypothetical protein